jgi:putative hemolysin
MFKRLIFSLQFVKARLFYYFRLLFASDTLKPQTSFSYESGPYEIKIAEKKSELLEVLRLRYHVFFQEFSTIKPLALIPTLDLDHHDFWCDHLIIKHKETQKIIACYRLRSSTKEIPSKYYTEGEFVLDDFLTLEGHKLELGRACVHEKFRNGIVLRLLWRGLCEYAARTETRYMFGCSSLARKDMNDWSSLSFGAKEKGSLLDQVKVVPTEDFCVGQYQDIKDICFTAKEVSEKKKGNSLLEMYLAAGAKISDSLAYDSEMDCVDIFTVLDFQKISPLFNRRLEPTV